MNYRVFWLYTFILTGFWLTLAGIPWFMATAYINVAHLEIHQALFLADDPDTDALEMARQKLYRSINTREDLISTLRYLRDVEYGLWLQRSRSLQRDGQLTAAYQSFTQGEWTRLAFEENILQPLNNTEDPDWELLGQAAERAQLHSLAAYLLSYDSPLPSNPGSCLAFSQSLIALKRFSEAEPPLRCTLETGSTKDIAIAHLLLAQLAVIEEHWIDAAKLTEYVLQTYPQIIATAEGAALVATIEQHAPLKAVTQDLRETWQLQKNNLLINGGFEQGFQAWGMWRDPGVNHGFDNKRVVTGLNSFAAKFDGDHDVNYYQVFQPLHLQKEQAYRISALMWSENLTGLLGIEVRSGEWFGGTTTTVTGSTKGWKLVELLFHTPVDLDEEVRITLRRYSGHGLLSGSVWVDNIILEKVDL